MSTPITKAPPNPIPSEACLPEDKYVNNEIGIVRPAPPIRDTKIIPNILETTPSVFTDMRRRYSSRLSGSLRSGYGILLAPLHGIGASRLNGTVVQLKGNTMDPGKSLTAPLGSLIKDAMQKAGVRGGLPAASPVLRVDLGDIEPLKGDPENSAAARQVLANIDAVRQVGIRDAFGLPTPDKIAEHRRRYVAMSFDEYREAIKSDRRFLTNFERLAKQNAATDKYMFQVDQAEIYQFLVHLRNKEMHTPNFQGYLNYVVAVNTNYMACIGRVPPPMLDDRAREEHTYITGGSGAGKTELMKALVFHDIKQDDRAVIIIDPQSNFSGTVARWKEFAGKGADRLVYFDPLLRPGSLPGLNPLDAGHLSKRDRSIYAGQLTEVMGQVVTQSTTDRWTTQTETVAQSCFEVALNTRGATLRHIRLALVEPEERQRGGLPPMVREFVRLGKQHHSEEVRTFFEYDFFKLNFASSKSSFSGKLGAALKNQIFSAVTCRPSTIHLEGLINERKIIVFNLGGWGDLKAAGAFGRMLIAQIVAIGMRRATAYGGDKVPVHVYVDEADKFIGRATLDALSKLRQHRMYMTMAQQVFARNLEGEDRRDIAINTGVKFTSGEDQKEMLAAMRAPPNAAHGLDKGQFVGRWGRDGEAFRLQVRDTLLGHRNCMTNEEWEAVAAHQVARYYAETDDTGDDYGQDTFSFDLAGSGPPGHDGGANDEGGYPWEDE